MIILAFTFLSLSAAAQKAPVNFYGTVVDAFTRQAIQGEVTCSLLRPDSTVMMTAKSYEHTDRGNGTIRTCFKFEIPEQADGRFLVKLEAKGYSTVYKPVKLVWKKKSIEISLWDTPMRRTSWTNDRQLGEATVTATKIKFYTKGDTLIYNADAFQLQEGSLLDALIAQLPGAELKSDGRIMVNGKFVESLLLNGRDFFQGGQHRTARQSARLHGTTSTGLHQGERDKQVAWSKSGRRAIRDGRETEKAVLHWLVGEHRMGLRHGRTLLGSPLCHALHAAIASDVLRQPQ